jgi:predicted nucleic acid-binding protein
MIVLDTNVVSEARKSTCNPRVKHWLAAQAVDGLYLSAISVLEIQRGIEEAAHQGDSRQAAVITTWLETIVLPAFSGRIIAVDHLIVRQAARLPWPEPEDYRDALIAASAMVHGATVATRNVRHFLQSGVALINPWERLVTQAAARVRSRGLGLDLKPPVSSSPR